MATSGAPFLSVPGELCICQSAPEYIIIIIMAKWDESSSLSFWEKRQFESISEIDNVEERKVKVDAIHQSREKARIAKKEQFLAKYAQHFITNCVANLPGSNISANLKFWIQHMSWTFCNKCKQLKTETLLPNYFKRLTLKFHRKCTCPKGIYFNPTSDDIPDIFKTISNEEIIALRPFSIHVGDYVVKENGYRQKTNMFRLTWYKQSVLEQIGTLHSASSQNKCMRIYNHLMQSENSTYSHFVNLREQEISHNIRFNVYDFNTNSGIECALWPHLYPTRRFCGTLLGGKEHRSSLKISFMNKVFGQICDYGTNFELLQFHYDLWIFKTVSAAITTGRNKNCSAVRALEDKTFSQEYWKWQHRSLIDAVRQLGYPSLFITISPSEWSFPIPPWISQLRELTGRGETELAAYETIHIVHILEQIVRGYMCGSNDKAWKSHLFSYQRKSSINNVLNYFYRFEFQKRGTVHMHMLVWLKSMSQIGLNNISADIPWNNKDDAFLVYNLQSSDKGSQQLFDDNTTVTNSNGTETLKMSLPAEAFAQNIRGYITTILPTLQCRMDVQSSDGHGLVLKYVSSYVSKTHDSFHSDCLYTVHTTPYQAAFRHLKEMTPLEPEMWLSLSSKKVAWNPHRVKKFAVPLPNTIHESTIVNKYCARPNNLQHMTLLQWLREVDTTKANTPVNRKGMTFVAAKLVSVFRDEYFFRT